MRYAKQIKVIMIDPTIGVDRLKEVEQGTETWTEGDIAAFEARWPTGTRPRLAMALLLYTGQRRSDVVRMGRQHVNAGVMEVRPKKSQGKTILHIPLHGDLAQCIALESSRLTFLMTGDGKPFTSNGFYNAFKIWCGEAGVPTDRSPHGLRKAACRRLADAGCSTHEIAAITGHKKLPEIELHIKAADQKRLARAAVAHIGRPKVDTSGLTR
jgi:integrase